MRRSPTCRFVSLNVPEASTAHRRRAPYVGPHMLSRAVVVTRIGSFSALARANTLCLSSPIRIVADARHETDLMIDEDERRVWEVRFRRAGLISHAVTIMSTVSQ